MWPDNSIILYHNSNKGEGNGIMVIVHSSKKTVPDHKSDVDLCSFAPNPFRNGRSRHL